MLEKLEQTIDHTRLVSELEPHLNRLIDFYEDVRDDMPVRVMTEYSKNHYVRNKRTDENWSAVHNNELTCMSYVTKLGQRMVSVFWNEVLQESEYVNEIVKSLNGTGDVHISIVLAGPKFNLSKHTDTMKLVRYHIPLYNNDNCYFMSYDNNTESRMNIGEIWKLDSSRPHATVNGDDKYFRVHLIIDFKP